MFTWITGGGNTREDSQPESMDATYIEPPETPAPVFAVRAFKHAIFGTPQPTEPPTVKAGAKIDRLVDKHEALKKAAKEMKEQDALRGILSTPGTSKERKSVSFGAHVVDNEGKKSNFVRSGLPTNYPGKFPSPWTPKTPADAETATKIGSSSKLTERLYQARESKKPEELKSDTSKPKPRSKDDGDITIDIMEPRSESGRYWKEQFQTYSEESEKEVKKLITKQKLAKNYAKEKDNEAITLSEKLEIERRRHRQREKELEEKNKEYKEFLRDAMAENAKSSTEIAALKQRLASLEAKATDKASLYVKRSSPTKILPKSQATNVFDEFLLDPLQASHTALEATPVACRRRNTTTKADKSPVKDPTAKDTENTSSATDKKAPSYASLGSTPRTSRRYTAGTRPEGPNAVHSHSETPSASAFDDLWVEGPSDVENKQWDSTSESKNVNANNSAPRFNTRLHARSGERTKPDRSLQLLSNLQESATTGTTPKVTSTEPDRRRVAGERVRARRRERKEGKENAKTNIMLMR